MKVVYLEWEDAQSTGGTFNRGEVDKMGLLLVSTVGILVSEDEEVVRLAEDYWKHKEQDGTEPEIWRRISVTPKRAIKRRLEWETEHSDRRYEISLEVSK